MEIKYNKTKGTVFINQHNYIEQVINRFNMEKANPSSADPHVHLTKSSDQNENKIPFREAVGALIFISIVSRPDIFYSVNQISRFVNNFNENHWNAVKKIMKYLKGTKHYGILLQRTEDPFQLTGWSDSDPCLRSRLKTFHKRLSFPFKWRTSLLK